jgi:UDP-N-acetylmuramyl pentapeptide phosphotransferase/UDP-N-acetylglucosamine-1-phosphate transferase
VIDPPWIGVALAATVSWAALAAMARTRWIVHLVDRPNERSLHANPTPRIGGLGIALGIAAGALIGGVDGPEAALLLAAAALLAVSLVDDVRSLPALVRLGAHAAAAVVAVGIAAPGLSPPLFVACVAGVAWATNLYNFMDGADGLAGGMSLVGFGTLAIAAASFGETGLATTCALAAAASAGFLGHNFPPARIFMGDAGSIPLGFLAAVLGLRGWSTGAWPAWFPLLVFSPFAVDATLTLLRRALAREPVWKAHRSHYYQRLVLSGWSHRRLALTAGALMIAAAGSALAARRGGFMLQCGTILAWAALYALLAIAIDRRAPRLPRSGRDAGPPAGQQ